MGAFVVFDTSRVFDSVKNHKRKRTSLKRRVRRKITSALAIAGGSLGHYTEGSRYVGEFATEKQANEAIGLVQGSKIEIGIGTDLSILAGRKSKKWLLYKPVTEQVKPSIWSASAPIPSAIEGGETFSEYWTAANVLSAPVVAAALSQRTRAFQTIRTDAYRALGAHVDEARGSLGTDHVKYLSAIGLEFLEAPAAYRLVFFWNSSRDSSPDHISFRGKSLKVRHDFSGDFQLQVNTHRRPPFCGCGISRIDNGALKGSIGCIVKKRGDTGGRYFLSASHVMGDGPTSRSGATVIQPAHTGNPGDTIGKVVFASPLLSAPLENHIDAAYAALHPGQTVLSTVGVNGAKIAGVAQPTKGMAVWKIGAGNGGPHHGTVNMFFATLRTKDPAHSRYIIYRNVWGCTPAYSADGDSGCAILTKGTDKIVGLHLAGNKTTSAFIDINSILDELNLDVVS